MCHRARALGRPRGVPQATGPKAIKGGPEPARAGLRLDRDAEGGERYRFVELGICRLAWGGSGVGVRRIVGRPDQNELTDSVGQLFPNSVFGAAHDVNSDRREHYSWA
ncbi:hypothetical protein M2432_005242 [Mycobacterium sp. OTB74]|nr:hypothetical protein [Mycobacterium sp. OTB74]